MRTSQRHRLRLVLIVLAGASLLLVAAFRFETARKISPAIGNPSSSRISRLPATILWAWERPEQLNFIDPQKVGVAFLAKTIYLSGDQINVRPRLQPLSMPEGTAVIAVARIESLPSASPALSAQQLKDTAAQIAELGKLPNVVMVQVDFDATLSQRSFYRDLLTNLRATLPSSTLLSMTALASWCKGDNWLDDLPVDEAVPMLFRMGVEQNQFRAQLAGGAGFRARPCQASAGVSTDEPLTELQPVQRLYAFNPEPWSATSFNHLMETYPR
ncbi:MAG TPA: hypothetical protein VGC61_09630 [Pyrinomonadaceae bacterium]